MFGTPVVRISTPSPLATGNEAVRTVTVDPPSPSITDLEADIDEAKVGADAFARRACAESDGEIDGAADEDGESPADAASAEIDASTVSPASTSDARAGDEDGGGARDGAVETEETGAWTWTVETRKTVVAWTMVVGAWAGAVDTIVRVSISVWVMICWTVVGAAPPPPPPP